MRLFARHAPWGLLALALFLLSWWNVYWWGRSSAGNAMNGRLINAQSSEAKMNMRKKLRRWQDEFSGGDPQALGMWPMSDQLCDTKILGPLKDTFFRTPCTVGPPRMALHQFNDYISDVIRSFGLWRPDATTLLLGLLATGHHSQQVYDVGANIGYFSVLAAWLDHEVIAFEPVHANRERLLMSMTWNGINNIQLVPMLVSKTVNDQLSIRTNARNMGGSHVDAVDASGVQPVSATTLDCAHSTTAASVRVMKIDVEGHEPQVILGASAFLSDRAADYILMEVTPTRQDQMEPYSQSLCTIAEAGYIALDFTGMFNLRESGPMLHSIKDMMTRIQNEKARHVDFRLPGFPGSVPTCNKSKVADFIMNVHKTKPSQIDVLFFQPTILRDSVALLQ